MKYLLNKTIRSLGISALMAVLAGDILILYYQGNWYDPNQFIEITEVIILYIITIISFCEMIRDIIKVGRGDLV